MQIVSEYSVAIIGILGVLAFAVSLITELLKDMPGIKKMPTKAFVILVSLIVTVTALLIYVAYAHIVLLLYYVAMYGWDTLKELKDRFVK